MSARVRWPVFAVGWLTAVLVTTVIASRAINFVGHQLNSDVSLPRATAAGPSSHPVPGPTGTDGSPTPSSGIGTPIAIGGAGPGGGTGGNTGNGDGTGNGTPGPGNPTPQVVPQPQPQPNPGSDGAVPPPVTSAPQPREPEQEQETENAQPVVPSQPEPASSPPSRPQPSPTTAPPATPVTFSSLRVVETSAGTASFRCSSSNDLALVSSSPAPGFTQGSRVRDSSRMDVTFVGSAAKKIDARCRDGQVDVSVE
ncbi:MAG: hypothetical protein QOE84_2943 [Actinomycetota bacterium]|nr:hypothetical protein [Actinomycetota bacterium]